MRAARDFWRLLGDYERLTLNESASLGAGEFDEVAAIQGQKDTVLARLGELAQLAGISRENDELSRRARVVLDNEARNKTTVDAMLLRAQVERQNLDAARQRLRDLSGAYAEEVPRRTAFSARV